MGHKGPVWRPRCIRPAKARTQILFYSILHWYFQISDNASASQDGAVVVLSRIVDRRRQNDVKILGKNKICHEDSCRVYRYAVTLGQVMPSFRRIVAASSSGSIILHKIHRKVARNLPKDRTKHPRRLRASNKPLGEPKIHVIFSSPKRQQRPWAPPILVSNQNLVGVFPEGGGGEFIIIIIIMFLKG